jgi:hypothetical protein
VAAVAFAAVCAMAATGARDSAKHRIWIPRPHTTWQWQLTTPVDLSVPAQMFDIDLFENSASVVKALHDHGRITFAQQLGYNRWLARTAHGLGLSIALKNDLGQVRQLEPDFDFALDEQCFQYSECSALRPFSRAGKAVFEVEYNLPPSRFCARANALGMMAMRKTLDLDRARTPCWS